MNQNHLHHLWKKRSAIKPWYFLILAAVFAVVCVYSLRENNLTMEHLRSDVYAADKNNGDVNGALKNLQSYVTSHMNTNLSGGPNAPYPPIQLEYTYERLQKSALSKLGYTSYYTQAQNYCQGKYPTDFYAQVPCVESYIEAHSINIKVTESVPPAALYEFDFVSPTWSPDLAGWSMVAAVVFLVAFIATGTYRKLAKRKPAA